MGLPQTPPAVAPPPQQQQLPHRFQHDARILYIRDRLAFLFSDANLVFDGFLRKILMRSGFVTLQTLQTFHTFRSLRPFVKPFELVAATQMLPDFLIYHEDDHSVSRVYPFRHDVFSFELRRAMVYNAPPFEQVQTDISHMIARVSASPPPAQPFVTSLPLPFSMFPVTGTLNLLFEHKHQLDMLMRYFYDFPSDAIRMTTMAVIPAIPRHNILVPFYPPYPPKFLNCCGGGGVRRAPPPPPVASGGDDPAVVVVVPPVVATSGDGGGDDPAVVVVPPLSTSPVVVVSDGPPVEAVLPPLDEEL